MSELQQIRNDIAFWAFMVMAQIALFNGSRIIACAWLALGALGILRARRARRLAEGRASFWHKVWRNR